MTWVAQPGMATPGKHYAPVAIAIGAFSAGGEDATRVGYLRSDGLLAAEAILQQDQFGTRAQAPGDLLDRLLGVVCLAGDQQALDRLVGFRGLCADGPVL